MVNRHNRCLTSERLVAPTLRPSCMPPRLFHVFGSENGIGSTQIPIAKLDVKED
ncbi:uncharacterized protein G2W53_023389 [Senna tora]|uniref:Uncharacterized protein n=1 Tax=Senna tora TaxID=362788 RepID=A0A834TIA3_9FABA|nr:uncharacterized protein G2W53_023389 [Senna tora]